MKENLNTISREELKDINILLQKTLKIKYSRNKIPGFFRNR